MQKLKKQKQEREIRQNLRNHTFLTPNWFSQSPATTTSKTPQNSSNSLPSSFSSNLLPKLYPQISQLNSLRILTIIEVNFFITTVIEILNKSGALAVEQLKIGIIGGGITGRLILNSLLVFAKGSSGYIVDGIESQNIYLSTRQTESFKFYADHFGVNVLFDNEKVADEVDVLFVATPATLDNWIIMDLKKPLKNRIKMANLNTHSQGSFSVSSKFNLNQENGRSNSPKKTTMFINNDQIPTRSNIQTSTKITEKKLVKPLVYITTSDISSQKCKKIFDFPVVTPAVRAKHLKKLKELSKESTPKEQNQFFIQRFQEILADWLLSPIESQHSEQYEEGNATSKQQDQQQNRFSKYKRTPFETILKGLAFFAQPSLTFQSINSSVSNSLSIQQSMHNSTSNNQKISKQFQAKTYVLDILTAANNNFKETFLRNCRKWRMAYSNFIA